MNSYQKKFLFLNMTVPAKVLYAQHWKASDLLQLKIDWIKILAFVEIDKLKTTQGEVSKVIYE